MKPVVREIVLDAARERNDHAMTMAAVTEIFGIEGLADVLRLIGNPTFRAEFEARMQARHGMKN